MKKTNFWMKIVLPLFSCLVTTVVSAFTVANVITNSQQIHRLNEQNQLSALQEQSKSVAAWVIKAGEYGKDNSGISNGVMGTVKLSNAGTIPVYNIFIVTMLNNEATAVVEDSLRMAASRNFVTHTEILPPGEHTITVPMPGRDMGAKHPVALICFTDSHNNQWVRNSFGDLIQVDYVSLLSNDGISLPYTNTELDK